MLKEYKTPPHFLYSGETFYAGTGTYYIEENRCGRCASCRWCRPARDYEFRWLRTKDGNTVSRVGYCYRQASDTVFRSSDGCGDYEEEEDREIIGVDELR